MAWMSLSSSFSFLFAPRFKLVALVANPNFPRVTVIRNACTYATLGAMLYSGTSIDSDVLKGAMRKEEDWTISWNEARLRNLAASATRPAPFAQSFAAAPAGSFAAAPAPTTPGKPPSTASSFGSTLRVSRSYADLRDPIVGRVNADVEDGRTFQTTARASFVDRSPSFSPQLASRIPDDTTLDAILMRRSQARGRGGGPATRLIDKVEHRVWTVLYTS